MTPYILIVLLWLDSNGNGSIGPRLGHLEFTSKDRCDAALDQFNGEMRAWSVASRQVRAFCAQK